MLGWRDSDRNTEEPFPFPGLYEYVAYAVYLSMWVKSAFHIDLMVTDCISDPYISPVGSYVFHRMQQITLAKNVLF